MIVVKKDYVEPKDLGEMLNNRATRHLLFVVGLFPETGF